MISCTSIHINVHGFDFLYDVVGIYICRCQLGLWSARLLLCLITTRVLDSQTVNMNGTAKSA